MKKKAIFLGQAGHHAIDQVFKDEIKERLHALVDLYPEVMDQNNIVAHQHNLTDVEIAFSTWGMPSFSEEEIALFLPNLRIIFYAAGSVQYFARPFLNKQIKVVSAWAANAVPVAEYTFAQIILANKGFYSSRLKSSNSYYDQQQHSKEYPGNYEAKVGILGAGMVGKMVIQRLHDLNVNIFVYDSFLSDEAAAELKVEKCSLEEIFLQCDVISNHIANLHETVGMLDGRLFDLMKPYATFINTGRGAQVVERDLVSAMSKVPTRIALLDVTDPEPVDNHSPLLELENIIITPHIAGSQANEVKRMAEFMLDEYERYTNDEPLQYEVTLKMLETMA